jgi:hypothetical protein
VRVHRINCDSQDLTLQAILSDGVTTVRQTFRRNVYRNGVERARKRRKLVLTPFLQTIGLPENPILDLKCGTIQSEGGLHGAEFSLKLVALGSMVFVHNAVAKSTEPLFQNPDMFSHSPVHHQALTAELEPE